MLQLFCYNSYMCNIYGLFPLSPPHHKLLLEHKMMGIPDSSSDQIYVKAAAYESISRLSYSVIDSHRNHL
jgi:hypothetical protein